MLNAQLGKVIRTHVLSEPGYALTDKNVYSLGIAFNVICFCRKEVIKDGSSGHIVQIEDAGIDTFGFLQGNAACPLIDATLVKTLMCSISQAGLR
jgi:hypothetical protein